MSRFTNDDYTYMGQLLQSIDARNWKGLEHLLRTQPRKFVSVSKLVAQSDQLNGMTILHACMRFDPPPRIVQIVILLSPRSPGSMDCLNRTPLHIAAGVRAKPESIAILLEACRKAASIQDADGKTPLHLACDNNW
jgi:ankyrin repeat protein